MDHILERSEDKEVIVPGHPQRELLHEVKSQKWVSGYHTWMERSPCDSGGRGPLEDTVELEAEQNQDLQREHKKLETDHLQHENPKVFTLQFSEENIPKNEQNIFFQQDHWNVHMRKQEKELGTDHRCWLENINNIIENINLTENTVQSLLNELMSLDGQIERLESHGDLDPDQQTDMEEKIMGIKKQLGEMDSKFVQEDACDEVHEQKGKLVARTENFCKAVTQLNTKLWVQERKTDTLNPEEMGVEKREALLPESPPPSSLQNSVPPTTIWKRALRIFIIFYVLTFIGLSCYTLFFDAAFIFENMLPTMLGHRWMWELRELVTPFLTLEVEDLLPS